MISKEGQIAEQAMNHAIVKSMKLVMNIRVSDSDTAYSDYFMTCRLQSEQLNP
jgi:hypothetical protein